MTEAKPDVAPETYNATPVARRQATVIIINVLMFNFVIYVYAFVKMFESFVFDGCFSIIEKRNLFLKWIICYGLG